MSVALIRNLLEEVLQPQQHQLYISKLRSWFNEAISQQQFEAELGPILQGEVRQLHNQLLFEILRLSGGVLTTDAAVESANELDSRIYSSFGITSQDASRPGEVPEATEEFELHKQEEDNRDLSPTPIDTSQRFPNSFMQDFYGASGSDDDESEVILNVTHGLDFVTDNLMRDYSLRKYFKIQDGLVLTSEAGLYARFLIEAWRRDVPAVEPEALNLAIRATMLHIKNVITETMKQTRSFRVRKDGTVYAVGAPYPNPYLLQGQHKYDDCYSSETAQLADVMQVPAFLPTQDERERVAALQVAASLPPKFPNLKTIICLADVMDALETNRDLIPNFQRRSKMYETILQRSRGYGDAYNLYKEGKDLVAKTVHPIVFY